MSGSAAATKVAAALARYGRAMTLRRRVGTTDTFTDVTVYGVTRSFSPAELVADIKQGDMEITISNSEITAAAWPGPPAKGDFIVVDGRSWTLQGAFPRNLSSTVLAFVLWARGG